MSQIAPTVSVVIPTYNRAHMIGDTLNSVLAQTYRNFEIIVVDDGSTDNTPEVLTYYGSPVHYVRCENRGKSAARNTGIRVARGDYIAFLDSDDLWLPNKLQAQMDVFDEQPDLKWVYSDCYMFDGQTGADICTWSSHSRLYAGNIFELLFQNNFIASPTPVFRRQVFGEVGYFDETLQRHQPEDADMWLRTAAKFPIGLVSRPLARFRRHPNSLTMREEPQLALQGVISVLELAVAREPARLGPLRGRVFAKRYVALGKGYAGMGQASAARTMFTKALRYYPAIPSAYAFWLGTWLGGKFLYRLHLLNVAKRGY